MLCQFLRVCLRNAIRWCVMLGDAVMNVSKFEVLGIEFLRYRRKNQFLPILKNLNTSVIFLPIVNQILQTDVKENNCYWLHFFMPFYFSK